MTIENQDSDTPKSSFIQLNTEKTCLQAIKAGWIAAIISAVLTALLALLARVPLLLIDAVLIVVLAYFIYKKSRVAATIMVIYFVGSKLMMLQATTGIQLVIAIIFTLIYVQAMRATYIWQVKYAPKATTPTNDENNTFVN